MEEEKKIESQVVEAEVVEAEVVDEPAPVESEEVIIDDPVSEEEENGFVDDVVEKKTAEKKAEEKKKAEEEAAAQQEQAKQAEATADPSSLRLATAYQGGATETVIESKGKMGYDYGDDNLAAIEKARISWAKSYRISSIIKISVSVFFLIVIILGWVIPATVMGQNAGRTPLFIALGCAGGALLAMFITSTVVKQKNKGLINVYFNAYYSALDAYVFDGLPIDGIQGGVESKVSQEEFEAGKVFLNTYSVGSRNSITFTYRGIDSALADAAGQEMRSNKTVGTAFVGKYLRMHNHVNVSDEGVIIYLKGGDRALPPSALLTRTPAVNDIYYNVYGSDKDIALISKEVMDAIAEIHTNMLLVDATISIQKGRTYFYLGYEDTLMILPNKEPFNPNYTIAYKKQLEKFLEIGAMLDKK